MKNYDVIIVGGGVTGTCIARDCALRGLRTLLLEKEYLCNGASGRNHGLLHSGARYAVGDPESARECIRENAVLRRIASSCIEETGGLLVSLPEDGLDYQKVMLKACRKAGIDARAIDPKEALKLAPTLNKSLLGAVKVPDASIDPFRFAAENALDAKRHGARMLKMQEVVSFVKEGDRIVGVKTDKAEFRGGIVVLAAGIWNAPLSAKAGVHLEMVPSKGSLLIFGHRVSDLVLNRCRKASNADIIVPNVDVSLLGTTSESIPFEECDNPAVKPSEADELLAEGCKMVPLLARTRIIRAYAGVRPLLAIGGEGRQASRTFALVDHEVRDSLAGLVSISGGKLTTARLMAEKTTDLICSKLGVKASCKTASLPLPGSEEKRRGGDLPYSRLAARSRHGEETFRMNFDRGGSEGICECEQVTRAEILYCIKEFGVKDLQELRRHCRLGMGTCQGSHCMRRAAEVLCEELGKPEKAEEMVREYLQERWKGMVPILWGETLREAEFMRKKYLG